MRLLLPAVLFLLLLTVSVLVVVNRTLRTTQKSTTEVSHNALLAHGEVSLLKITRREAELMNHGLREAGDLTQVAADFMVKSNIGIGMELVPISSPNTVSRIDQLVRREDGGYYDANPNRATDVSISSLRTSKAGIEGILRESSPLDLIFPPLFSRSPDAVGIFYQDISQSVIREYPTIDRNAVDYPGTSSPQAQPPTIAIDWRSLRELNWQATGRRTIWQSPHFDPASGGLMITAVTPVYFGDDPKGVIGLDLHLDSLVARLAKLRPTPNTSAFLMNNKGELVAAPLHIIDGLFGADVQEDDIFGSTPAQSLLHSRNDEMRIVAERMRSGESGTAETQLDGEQVIVAYAPLSDIGWSLGVLAPIDDVTAGSAAVSREIDENVDATVNATLLTILTFALIAMLGALVVSRSIIFPITSLIAGTRALADGDLSIRLQVSTPDEIGHLARSFNEMAARLEDANRLLEQRVAARTRELTSLLQVGRSLTSTLDIEPLVALILDQLRVVIDSPSAAVFMYDEETKLLSLISFNAEVEPKQLPTPYRLKPGSLDQAVFRNKKPFIIADVLDGSKKASIWRIRCESLYGGVLPGIRSWMALPMLFQNRPIGMLTLGHHEPNAYTSQHVELATAFADQVAVAIQNARLFESVQHAADRFRVISELGQRITSILDVDELLSQTAHLIQDAFGYYHVHIGLVDGDHLVFPEKGGVYNNEPVCTDCSKLRVPLNEDTICGVVARSGEPLVVNDIPKESRYLHPKGAIGSGVVVPLKVKDEVIGLIDVENAEPNSFDESSVAVLQLLANQVAVAIENARLYEKAQKVVVLQERQRISRELHDSVSQSLYGIGLGIRTAQALLEKDTEKVEQALDYVLSLADAGLAEMRALIIELRPEQIDSDGLVLSLKNQLHTIGTRHHIRVKIDLCEEPDLSIEQKQAVFRIIQEALHNTIKHANASQIDVRMETQDDSLVITIKDDGQGFDPSASFPGHFGLQTMRERTEYWGGTLTVQSASGKGTLVTIRLPYPPVTLAGG